MFTICPKCALTLVVTAADLRVAQGYVRCGRCSSVFNALARLTDERASGVGREEEPSPGEAPESGEAPEPPLQSTDVAAAATTEAAPPEGSAASPAGGDEDAIPDDALEFDPTKTDLSTVFVDPPPNPQWTAATGSFKAMIAAKEEPAEVEPEPDLEVEVDAAFLASMLRTEASSSSAAPARSAPATPAAAPAAATPATPSAPAPLSSPPAPPTSPTSPAPPESPASPKPHEARPRAAQVQPPASRTRPAARHAAPHVRPDFEAKVQPAPGAHTGAPTASSAESKPLALEEPAPQSGLLAADTVAAGRGGFAVPAHLEPLVWRVGAAIGALLLLVQILNHYRDDLAATARFNRPLTALYGALGVRLAPHWDVHAYDVRQLGAAVEPGSTGLITVRASIKNGAPHPQPLPLLRVTLQDRFGNRIASSDVAPRFYLPPTVPASSFLSGGQRIDAEMGFVDPGTNAVGFEIDACLPSSGGGVTCANDVSTR